MNISQMLLIKFKQASGIFDSLYTWQPQSKVTARVTAVSGWGPQSPTAVLCHGPLSSCVTGPDGEGVKADGFETV